MTTAKTSASTIQREDFGDDNFAARQTLDNLRLKKQKALEKWIGSRVIVTFTLTADVPNGVKSVKGILIGFTKGESEFDLSLDLRNVSYYRDEILMMGNKEFSTRLDNIETVELA